MPELPFVLSPYLRPFRRNGVLFLDNGVVGHAHEITADEARIVDALWIRAEAPERLDALADDLGVEATTRGLEGLFGKGVVFQSETMYEAALQRTLERGNPGQPYVDQIELTNHCPMRCGFCPRGIPGRVTRPKGFMSLALFERLLGMLHPRQRNYRPLELHHLGESLLNPDLPRFVAAASKRRLPTELSVNPALLTPALSRELLDAGLSRLVISMDGMDQPTLTALRGPAADFERSVRHIDALLELVAGRAHAPQVVIQMLDLQRNRGQHEAFLERFAHSGLPTVEAYVKNLDGPDPDTGTETSTPLVYLCTYPWRSVVILWDGRVVPCCRDDDAHLVLGDINTQTLEEIWHGPQAQALRRAHLTGEFAPGHLCAGCAWQKTRFKATFEARHPRNAPENPLAW